MSRFATATTVGLALALLALAGTGTAVAQYGPGPGGRAPYSYQPSGRNEAGRFDYYALVLSWSPTYCAARRRGGYDPQCDRRSGRPYAFVLHGLWPQHERGWPENCRTRWRPYVPRSTIDSMLDIMPSPKLVIHEYRKHGTCSGLEPDAYFDYARKMYFKLKVPQRYVRPNEAFFVSPDQVKDDFLEANPALKPDGVAVVCGGRGGRLREVRICFSREGAFRACGRNEDARRLCSRSRLYVPPVRGGAPGGSRDADQPEPRGRSPLPGPLDPPRRPGDERRT